MIDALSRICCPLFVVVVCGAQENNANILASEEFKKDCFSLGWEDHSFNLWLAIYRDNWRWIGIQLLYFVNRKIWLGGNNKLWRGSPEAKSHFQMSKSLAIVGKAYRSIKVLLIILTLTLFYSGVPISCNSEPTCVIPGPWKWSNYRMKYPEWSTTIFKKNNRLLSF